MGVHIDDELLARLIGPGLSERERRPVLAHLESCDACRRSAADAMQLADETRTLAGRYRLEGELGRGGMGMVFRARDDVLERIVAIKLLPPGTTAEPRARARLVRESKAMARLRHPNVVAVYDAGYDGDQFFVAMEHVPGATLRTWLSTRKRTQPEIVAMLAKAARGLAAAHAVGVIHRDFKPDNVLVDEHGEPRVADFGLARTDETVDFDEYERDEVSIADGLTATGQELGTPAYMAPEQYGGEIDRRVDVFAFCVVLHEALFGVRPFTEVSIEARLGAIARGERVAVRRIDRRLQRVLDRGLAADPARRFATMEDVVAALERSGGQRGRWVVAAGLVGTLALGGAALWSTRAEPCAAPDDRLRAAWSSAAIPRIEQAHFDALPHLEAQMTWSRLRPSIDGVVAALDQEELLLCEAQRKGELDDELAWRRGACLRHERGAIAYRLELAAEGDVAASRGLDLGEPAPWCRALAQELRGDAPESANAAAHAEVERGLAEIAALNRMGRDDALLAHAPAVIAAAEQIGEPLLAARARFELGRQTPDDDQASATLEQAAHAAAAEGEHVTAAKAWVYSGYYATDDRRRFLDAAHVELAQVVEPQVRDRVLVQAELLEAQILDDEGDREAARACLERAIVLARAEAPAAVPDILFMSTWLAWADGELALALATQRELVRWHDD
ncbi:MAG TPA: serine/threonine-protein kinase, partial [Nannocystaceae bacterium]|nr:serine/threonine-protein kinase [Nannocystaceae bacterium]